jgi:hypothetical protein
MRARKAIMDQTIDKNAWVYVVVQNPGGNETIVGQHDAEHDIHFVPVFRDRDSALLGVTKMVKEPGQTFEIQAIIYDDLVRYSAEGGFLLFILDGQGNIAFKLRPDGQPL